MTRELLLTIHLIAIISWMAGILYLIRLFVYHAEETNEIVKQRFAVMERRLYLFITMPSMLVAFIAGISLIYINPALMQGKWLHTKLLLVLILAGVTGFSNRYRKNFLKDNAKIPTGKFFRIFNEIPTLLMIIIIYLVIYRPF